ncbi:conserved hypothetical protein [Paecilomyces variotii No. 5]|uniref:Uncharacterized protein n=1 Tax=Byssochlamys spectabilis (strain No. 5 / NBRC 109023) TaxID=1356009 RepID=V5G3D6_BYSSN|nr:conserved hypothetical protein [Paecilomyces variotii No. 5]
MSSVEKDHNKVEVKPSHAKDKESKYVIGANRGPLAPPSGDQESDIARAEYVEAADSASTQTKGKKIKRHFRRFWFCYVLLAIILAAILLPILFVFIVPAIAQDVLDSSKLVITEAHILQPRPDSVVLTMLSALNLAGFSVQMDPMTLGLFVPQLGPSPFANLYLPATKVHGNTTLGVTNQFTPIINQTSWQGFVDNAVNLGVGVVGMEGRSKIHMGKLHADLNMHKEVPSNALNQFQGFAIEDSTLLLPPEADGTNLIANATLPNQSVMTLEIVSIRVLAADGDRQAYNFQGNTTLNLLSGDLVIGNATINNLIIKPGNNSAPVRGILDLHKIIQNLSSILQSQGEAIKNGNIELTSIGSSVTYEGVTVPYYEKVLKNLTLKAQVPIAGLILNTIHGINQRNGSHLLSSLNLTDSLGDDTSDSLKSLNHTRLVDKLIENYGRP